MAPASADEAGLQMRFADVAVDAPAGLGRTFSYSIPRSVDVLPGHLVKVPFGSRTLQGVVFSLASVPQVPETREILATEGPGPLLTEFHLALARWMADHYMCPLFEAASVMLPPGRRVRSRTYLSLGAGIAGVGEQSLTPLQDRVLGYVRSRGTADQERLIAALGQTARASIASLVERDILARSVGRGRPALGSRYRHHARLTPGARTALVDWSPEAEGRAPRRAALIARLLEDGVPLDLADARREYGTGAVNALMARGWVETERVLVDRDPLAGKEFAPEPHVVLTPPQAAVAREIRSALGEAPGAPRTFLVAGVTGSGKTEIYLDALEHCLGLGKKAIILVPEIALTHQTIERFAARFPGRVGLLHSGLSSGERHDQWWKIRNGEYGVVVGSRSAIFAPQPDLGLVVIDEEHEWTYKQHDASPRYHAREVALKMADLTGAVVVLGSASPDVVSYHRGLRREFRLLTLPQRFRVNPPSSPQAKAGLGAEAQLEETGGGVKALASVEVVDMRRELREGNRGIFSRALTSAMDDCLDSGDQMILFLNRRGSSSYTQCRNCGFALRCRRCDIALTYHRDAGRLVCHYCGSRRSAPGRCPKCLSYRLSYYGVGTQAVVDRVKERTPDATVLRWDRDAAKSFRDYQGLLERFRSGEAQVLVGTQMIAKGLHFPSVTLVGVVSADVGLNIPDYRAGERAFQLLYQVAGRAGRGPAPGRVIVQTYQPDNYAVRAAASQDYDRFYRQELAFRRQQANPPFSGLIRLLYANTNRALCEREASRMAGLLKQQRADWGYSDVDILGPTPAYPARLRGHYRWHLVLRGPAPRVLLDKVAVPHGWVVDIDPVTLT